MCALAYLRDALPGNGEKTSAPKKFCGTTPTTCFPEVRDRTWQLEQR